MLPACEGYHEPDVCVSSRTPGKRPLASGQRKGDVSKFSGSTSIQHQFRVADRPAFVRVGYSYHGPTVAAEGPGTPNFNPDGLASRAVSEYREGQNLIDMIREDLIAERIAVEHYRELVRYFGDNDPTTRVMLESILANGLSVRQAEELARRLNAAGAGAAIEGDADAATDPDDAASEPAAIRVQPAPRQLPRGWDGGGKTC